MLHSNRLILDAFYSCTEYQIRSVTQSCPTLCDPINHSTPGRPVHHQLPEFTQTHVHRVSHSYWSVAKTWHGKSSKMSFSKLRRSIKPYMEALLRWTGLVINIQDFLFDLLGVNTELWDCIQDKLNYMEFYGLLLLFPSSRLFILFYQTWLGKFPTHSIINYRTNHIRS